MGDMRGEGGGLLLPCCAKHLGYSLSPIVSDRTNVVDGGRTDDHRFLLLSSKDSQIISR